MNNFPNKRVDDMHSFEDQLRELKTQLMRNKARDLELEKELREMEESKEHSFDEKSLKYSVMSRTLHGSMDSSMAVLLSLLKE